MRCSDVSVSMFPSQSAREVPHQGTWLLEKRVVGQSFRGLLEESCHFQKAAETLALLHGHERRRYGKVGTWGGRRLSVRWRQRFQERWAKITGLFPELADVGHDVEKWFHNWADAFTPRELPVCYMEIITRGI